MGGPNMPRCLGVFRRFSLGKTEGNGPRAAVCVVAGLRRVRDLEEGIELRELE
jgi:hypothetical protein